MVALLEAGAGLNAATKRGSTLVAIALDFDEVNEDAEDDEGNTRTQSNTENAVGILLAAGARMPPCRRRADLWRGSVRMLLVR